MSYWEALAFGFAFGFAITVIGGGLARAIFNLLSSWRPFAPRVEGKVPEPKPPQARSAKEWDDWNDRDVYP